MFSICTIQFEMNMVIRKTMYWIIGIFLFCGWADLVWGQTEKWSDESITLATTLTSLSAVSYTHLTLPTNREV